MSRHPNTLYLLEVWQEVQYVGRGTLLLSIGVGVRGLKLSLRVGFLPRQRPEHMLQVLASVWRARIRRAGVGRVDRQLLQSEAAFLLEDLDVLPDVLLAARFMKVANSLVRILVGVLCKLLL